MCGISAFFARESVPDFEVLDTLFKGMMSRGQDGFGLCWIHNYKNDGRKIQMVHRSGKNYDDSSNIDIVKTIRHQMNIGDVLIGIQRAAPETESLTDPNRLKQTMQPIYSADNRLVCVHNGSVSGRTHNELREWSKTSGEYVFRTEIDSESIIAATVRFRRNMKDVFQYLSGGFAVIMYDEIKDCLYVVNDHMQIAHSYSRVVGGFMLHSELGPLENVLGKYHGVLKDGVNIWENYYHHFLDGHAIRKIDLQSGCMSKQSYTPRYIVGNTFDTSK